MNCIDFRRDALAQPLGLGEAAREHLKTCAACTEFLERQRRYDAELFDALQVPVPDGLADRIVLAQGIRTRQRPWLWGVAASVLLAAGLYPALAPVFAGKALASEAIAHVLEEPESFTVATQAPRDAEFLGKELAAQGVRLAASLGPVVYAQLCPMQSGKARHIVVSTPEGLVTLLLMPADTTSRHRSQRDANGFTAIAMSASRGSIAIVAATPAQAAAVERMLIIT